MACEQACDLIEQNVRVSIGGGVESDFFDRKKIAHHSLWLRLSCRVSVAPKAGHKRRWPTPLRNRYRAVTILRLRQGSGFGESDATGFRSGIHRKKVQAQGSNL
jgi:hypothetical protein